MSTLLTLATALQIAQRNSLAVQTGEAKLAQAKSLITQTYAGLYPQLSLTTSAIAYDQIDANAIGGLGGGLGGGFGGGFGGGLGGGLGGFGGAGLGGAGGAGGGFVFDTVQTSLSLTQTLFDGYQVPAALRLADATVAMDEVDVANQERLAAYNAANAYIQALRTDGLRQVARDAVAQAQAHLASAEARERAGIGTHFDVLQAQSQLASVQGQLRAAVTNLELARLALSNALGEPLGDRRLNPDLALASATFDLESDLGPAIENRPEVQTLELKRRVDQANVDLNGVANWPKAQAQVQYSQQGLGTGRSLMGLVGVSWTLVDWGKAAARTESSKLDLAQTDQSLALARRNLVADIQGAVLNRQDAQDRLAIAQKGLEFSQESYRMARVRFDSGVGTGYEVIDAQTQFLQAQNTYVQAAYDVQAAEVRLAQALGVDLNGAPARLGQAPGGVPAVGRHERSE